MASTALPTLPSLASWLNFDESSLLFQPDLDYLSTTSVSGILGALSPSLADLVTEVAGSLDEVAGQILVTAGVFETTLLLPDGTTFTDSFDAPTTLNNLASLAAITNGTVTLVGGILNAEITTGDQSLVVEDLDVAALASTFVLDVISRIDTTIPFEKGTFILAGDTVFGPISGTVDVGGGDLNIDLSTPFGPLVADIDFGEEAVFPFQTTAPIFGTTLNIDGVVDFNAGNVVASAGSLGSITIPISTISGALTLADGIGTLTADLPITGLPFGGTITVPVSAEFEVGPLASELVADFVQDLTLDATITDGVLEASLDSPLGLFETTFDIVAFTQQGAEFFAGVDGVIDIADGLVVLDLTTPVGDINRTFDLNSAAGLLEAPLAGLV
ncbi:MAG TPA: hypothetical protein IGR64_09775 [Leptolyngbyaceae cyanobacterium M65_K2018_010]|nr:hypothetical protein [Leptolyngbyaceae cyanobacterium M65_K2018_010]